MLCFICRDSYNDYLAGNRLMETMIAEALVEADFAEDEVELRFADTRLMGTAIRLFNQLAYEQRYKSEILRETEINIWGIDGTKTRFVFMNSIPENSNGS